MSKQTIIDMIERRRATIRRMTGMSAKRRAKSEEAFAAFPLNYSASEMEIAIACDIDWGELVVRMSRLIDEGKWELISGTSRTRNGRIVQRVR